MSSMFEEGRERCPYDPAKGYTGLLIGKEVISTSFLHCVRFSVTLHSHQQQTTTNCLCKFGGWSNYSNIDE